MPGLEGGIRKRAAVHLAGCLPYLWRTIKYEEVYVHEYASPKEARQQLHDYLQFYNHQRLHQALDYCSPASVYFAPKKQEGAMVHLRESDWKTEIAVDGNDEHLSFV